MGLGHEKLDVYRLAIEDVAWVYEKAEQDVLKETPVEELHKARMECGLRQEDAGKTVGLQAALDAES
jgi:hypothetical protein